MAGFIKGMLIGVAIGAAGFLAVALLVPPDPAPMRDLESEEPVADADALPEPEPEVAEVAPAPDDTPAEEVDPPEALMAEEPHIAPPPETTEPAETLPEEATAEPTPLPDADISPEAQALAAERGATGAEPLPDPTEDDVTAAAELAADLTEAPAIVTDEDADAPAWQRYAAAFQAPAERALYAVILVDAPADANAEAALLALPAPVTVALDPADPDAPRRATAYRSAGHEVAILAPGAENGDALSSALAALPEAVAWILTPTADAALASAAQDAGLVVVRPRADAEVLTDHSGPLAWIMDEIALDTARIVVIARLDRVARRGEELGVVASLLGPAANPAMLEALMQRAGREGTAPAAPAPVTAAVDAAR